MLPTSTDLTRRRLICSSLAAGTALATASTPKDVVCAGEKEKSEISADARVFLFQGDSITDAGRDRKRQATNDSRSLGRGYPLLIAGRLLQEYPARKLQIHNRGISGNKVPDLQKRWKEDCLDIKPDVLSILIGVNDIWHKLNGRYDGTVKDYQDGYRKLLEETQKALPNTKIVVCEPFVLRCGAVNDKWFPEFDQRREAALQLASELSLTVVRFQEMFDTATESGAPGYWAGDGVHPTLAGHALMAKTWCETVGV